jgi:DNA-binding IscR family transcriptional regulator
VIRDLTRVTFYELNEVIIGPLALAKCLEDEAECDLKKNCNILSPISVLNRRMMEFYQDLSVGELLRVKERSGEARAEVAP